MAKKPSKRQWGRAAQRVDPEGKARQSQVVTTYGPGSMVDLLGHAAVVGGLDFWRYEDESKRIIIFEPRLREIIDLRLRAAKRTPLNSSKAFVEPPAGSDRDPSPGCGIAALEFPAWFVCQIQSCRALMRADGLAMKSGKYIHDCDTNSRCVPVRFVGACRHGHLQDFPWIYFLHGMQGKPNCDGPSLRLLEGATGDFAEIRVVCVCGASRPLVHAMVREAGPKCEGKRPWLGREGNEQAGCGEQLRLMVRTASNSYFAQVVSALSIPEKRSARDIVREVLDLIGTADASSLPVFRQIPKVKTTLEGFSDAEVLEAIKDIKENRPILRDPLRTAEFKTFMAAKPEATGELPKPKDPFFARSVTPKGGLPKNVGKLVLAHKLREVRVEVGFTRIEPETPDLQGEFDLGVRSSPLGLQTDWLPASEIHGEGILLLLDEKAVQQWEDRPAVQMRGRELLAGYEAWAKNMPGALPFPGMRFYMIHSLAHLLITALSLECGYAASAIRERLYCAPADDPIPMAAILLSTGSPGTEGTLGGLAEQGRNLRQHLRQAFSLGSLCSNDPVCAKHTPKNDLAERHLEGAACHGCLFIAECSCERYNRYLDRALVVPTIGYEDVAFFSEMP